MGRGRRQSRQHQPWQVNHDGRVRVRYENLLVHEVTTAAVSLCRAVELIYLFNVKPRDELLPYLGPQAVTEHHSDLVLVLELGDWSGVQISGNLSYVLATLNTDRYQAIDLRT